jgi:YVTN family beta-propeller protein
MKPESAAGPSAPSGLYLLDEEAGAGALSFYNLSTRQITPDQYQAVNGNILGDGGNDVEIYGSKMYIAVTNSSVIDIVNAKTGKLIKQDSLLNPVYGLFGYARKPTNIAFYKGNAYISCSDGTIAIMDTVNLSVNAKITLPGVFYLGGLVVQNDKLYVADSGAGPSVTDIVSVIDLSTNQEIKRINVIPYPVSMAADSYGNVYVLSGFTDDWHQFDISTGGLTIIDSKTDNLKSPSVVGLYPSVGNIPITVNGDLVYYATYATGNNKIAVYNAKTQTAVTDNFITDGTNIQFPASICANPVTGEVYVSDAKDFALNGVVDVFDKTGKLEYSFPTGVNPVKVKLLN